IPALSPAGGRPRVRARMFRQRTDRRYCYATDNGRVKYGAGCDARSSLSRLGKIGITPAIAANAGGAIQQRKVLGIHVRNTLKNQRPWIPAFAGMTTGSEWFRPS